MVRRRPRGILSFGVLTCNTLEQAIDRAGAKGGNQGFDDAISPIEMANLMRRLPQHAGHWRLERIATFCAWRCTK